MSIKILAVDDSASMRQMVRAALEAGGDEVREAQNSQDALDARRLISLGLDELKTAGEGRGRQSAALKYFASGWWKTSADTDASGSIMKPSVSVTPIRSSGRSSRQSVA